MRRPSLISQVRSCISPGNKLSTRPFIYLFSTVSASRKCFTLVPDVNYSTVKYRACRSRMTRYSMPGRSARVRCRHMICNNDVFVCACDQRGDCPYLLTVRSRMPTGTGNGLHHLPRRDHRGRHATTKPSNTLFSLWEARTAEV